MLTAYIHLDESLLREVEVYTARTLEIKAQLCEKVIQNLSTNKVDTSRMSQQERAARATEFFMEYDIGACSNGLLSFTFGQVLNSRSVKCAVQTLVRMGCLARLS